MKAPATRPGGRWMQQQREGEQSVISANTVARAHDNGIRVPDGFWQWALTLPKNDSEAAA